MLCTVEKNLQINSIKIWLTLFKNGNNLYEHWESHKFRLSLSDKLKLKNPNKNIALGNSSIYYI